MRVALFGSPAFALPILEALHQHHDLVLVVAQPDKAAGRGLKLTPPPVAVRARELGLPLEQPAKFKNNHAFHMQLQKGHMDVAITAAYGKILPQSLLDIPRHGFLNVHASLLPKYRGAAPIQWALINGEQETGITIMQTEAGLDTGPIRLQTRTPVGPDDTAVTLFDNLATLGASAMLEALELLDAGNLPCIPQDDALATHAPLLTKEDGAVRWFESAQRIYDRYRGVFAWPGTWTTYDGGMLKVHGLEPGSGQGAPGHVVDVSPEGVRVGTAEGLVVLKTVQPAGKPRMDAHAWANGYQVRRGSTFG
jgi:methionyl-tRNA formyltransferase